MRTVDERECKEEKSVLRFRDFNGLYRLPSIPFFFPVQLLRLHPPRNLYIYVAFEPGWACQL